MSSSHHRGDMHGSTCGRGDKSHTKNQNAFMEHHGRLRPTVTQRGSLRRHGRLRPTVTQRGSLWRQESSTGGVDLEGASLQHHREGDHMMGSRAGQTRKPGVPLLHRALAIELASARELRSKGTEGPAATETRAGRAGGPPLTKIPPRRGAVKGDPIRFFVSFFGGPVVASTPSLPRGGGDRARATTTGPPRYGVTYRFWEFYWVPDALRGEAPDGGPSPPISIRPRRSRSRPPRSPCGPPEPDPAPRIPIRRIVRSRSCPW